MKPPEGETPRPARGGRLPPTARGKATRQRILAAAEREIAKKGYDRASIGVITMRARIGVGTFYLYFSSKKDVLCTLVRDLGRQLSRQFACNAPCATPVEMQRQCVQAYIRFRSAHPGLDRVVNATEWVDGDVFRGYYENLATGLQLDRRLHAHASAGDDAPSTRGGLGVDHFLRLWQTISWVEPQLDTATAAAATAAG